METISSRIAELYQRTDADCWLTLLISDQDPIRFGYRDVIDIARRYGAGCRASGLAPGERIILILQHSPELYLAHVGALLAGCVPAIYAPPSPKLDEAEFFRIACQLIKVSGARLIVTTPDLRLKLKAVAPMGTEVTTADLLGRAATRRETADFEPADPAPDSTAFLQYSSGTTGLKKCVAISHQALLWQVDRYAEAIGLNQDDRIASWLPLYHDMGLIACWFMPLLTATPLVALSPFAWVRKPGLLLQAVSRHRATLCWLPNFAYHLMARAVSEEEAALVDLGGLRGIVNCSEPVTAEAHERFLTRFASRGLTPHAFRTSYALAENTFAVTSGGFASPLTIDRVDAEALADRALALPAGDGGSRVRLVVGSGRPLPDTLLRILGEDGTALPDRQVGEIAFRSPGMLRGYGPEAAQAPPTTADGLYLTGDLGYLADGELFVVGRRNDLIIIGGKNIFPQDIEVIVDRVPGVIPGRAVAFGVFDDRIGTQRLCIVAESHNTDANGRAKLSQEIHAAISASSETTPDGVLIVEPGWLAKSTSGKLSRDRNRDRYLERLKRVHDTAGAAGDANGSIGAGDADPVLRAVRRCVHRIVAERELFASVSLADDEPVVSSGLIDSLQLAILIVTLEEELGIDLPEDTLGDAGAFDTIATMTERCRDAAARTLPENPKAPASRNDRVRERHDHIANSLVSRFSDRRYILLPALRESDQVGNVPDDLLRCRVRPHVRLPTISTDRFGFRGTIGPDGLPLEFDAFWRPGVRRGLLLGNSTPFGVGASDNGRTIASLLNRRSPPDRPVWFNMAVRASTVADECRVAALHAAGPVEWIVIITGINDLSFFVCDQIRRIAAGNSTGKPIEQWLTEVVGRIGIELRRLLSGFGDPAPRLLFALQPVAPWIAKPFTAEERELLALSAADNDLASKVLPSPLFLNLYQPYADCLRQMCAELNVDFIDFNREPAFTSSDWLFVDGAHLTDLGQRHLADTLFCWLEGCPNAVSNTPQRTLGHV